MNELEMGIESIMASQLNIFGTEEVMETIPADECSESCECDEQTLEMAHAEEALKFNNIMNLVASKNAADKLRMVKRLELKLQSHSTEAFTNFCNEQSLEAEAAAAENGAEVKDNKKDNWLYVKEKRDNWFKKIIGSIFSVMMKVVDWIKEKVKLIVSFIREKFAKKNEDIANEIDSLEPEQQQQLENEVAKELTTMKLDFETSEDNNVYFITLGVDALSYFGNKINKFSDIVNTSKAAVQAIREGTDQMRTIDQIISVMTNNFEYLKQLPNVKVPSVPEKTKEGVARYNKELNTTAAMLNYKNNPVEYIKFFTNVQPVKEKNPELGYIIKAKDRHACNKILNDVSKVFEQINKPVSNIESTIKKINDDFNNYLNKINYSESEKETDKFDFYNTLKAMFTIMMKEIQIIQSILKIFSMEISKVTEVVHNTVLSKLKKFAKTTKGKIDSKLEDNANERAAKKEANQKEKAAKQEEKARLHDEKVNEKAARQEAHQKEKAAKQEEKAKRQEEKALNKINKNNKPLTQAERNYYGSSSEEFFI